MDRFIQYNDFERHTIYRVKNIKCKICRANWLISVLRYFGINRLKYNLFSNPTLHAKRECNSFYANQNYMFNFVVYTRSPLCLHTYKFRIIKMVSLCQCAIKWVWLTHISELNIYIKFIYACTVYSIQNDRWSFIFHQSWEIIETEQNFHQWILDFCVFGF